MPPLQSLAATVTFLAARAVPGIEDACDGVYRRTLRLRDGPGVLELRAATHRVLVADPRDRVAAQAASRRLLGSDAAEAADAHLAADPHLGPLVAARPRLQVPGTVDGGELAIRAVLGQQISLAAARKLAGRLVAMAGERVEARTGPLSPAVEVPGGSSPRLEPAAEVPGGSLTHVWPRPEAVVEVAGAMPMPRARQVALAALAGALAVGNLRLEPGVDHGEARRRLLELPGIGPWTAEYIAMRALADPDAWLPTDVGVRHGLARLGVSAEASEGWRPYRAHAVAHLWASL